MGEVEPNVAVLFVREDDFIILVIILASANAVLFVWKIDSKLLETVQMWCSPCVKIDSCSMLEAFSPLLMKMR